MSQKKSSPTPPALENAGGPAAMPIFLRAISLALNTRSQKGNRVHAVLQVLCVLYVLYQLRLEGADLALENLASKQFEKAVQSFFQQIRCRLPLSTQRHFPFRLLFDETVSVSALACQLKPLACAKNLNLDELSDTYEVLLQYPVTKISKGRWELRKNHGVNPRKRSGSFFTPLAVCEHLLNQTPIDSKTRIFDPTCGSGQFLIASLKRMRSQGQSHLSDRVLGCDMDPAVLFLAALRLWHFLGDKDIPKHFNLFCLNFTDAHASKEVLAAIGRVDCVLANPPFGASTNCDPRFANTWQSCLARTLEIPGLRSVGIVLPASFASGATDNVSQLRRMIIERSSELRAVAFDTRPQALFGDADQRVLLLSAIFGNTKAKFYSGGFRRHTGNHSIGQSLSSIRWQAVNLFLPSIGSSSPLPLPGTADEKALVQRALQDAEKFQLRDVLGDKYPISFLVYGRYNLNAILGPPPNGGGQKWRTIYFRDRALASKVVVGLNSTIGWVIFRSLSNGLDLTTGVVSTLTALMANSSTTKVCEPIAMELTRIMRTCYTRSGHFSLAGKLNLFCKLDDAVAQTLDLRANQIDIFTCSDQERARILSSSETPLIETHSGKR